MLSWYVLGAQLVMFHVKQYFFMRLIFFLNKTKLLPLTMLWCVNCNELGYNIWNYSFSRAKQLSIGNFKW